MLRVRRSTLILSSPTGQSKGQKRGVQRECWQSCLAMGLEEWGIWTSPWEQTFKSCWWLGYYRTAGLLCFLEPGKEKKEKTLLLLQTVLNCSFINPFQGPGWCGIGNCLPTQWRDKARLSLQRIHQVSPVTQLPFMIHMEAFYWPRPTSMDLIMEKNLSE